MKLPVQIALGALVLYVLTLSHGATLANLPLMATLAGWDTAPMNGQPLLCLTTLPLRLLPAGWIAPALNLYSAILAALVLGILAWSLELAAWDRPLESLGRRSQLPILIACVLCGLEYNFWREATVGTGEMIQLALFAGSMSCLFKYRAARKFGWMYAAAFLWGMGMVENWMMFFLFPVFVMSLIWLARHHLLRWKRILRLLHAGVLGFLVIFIPPLVRSVAQGHPLHYFTFCLQELIGWKSALSEVRFEFWSLHRLELVVAVIFYLVPVLPVILRGRYENTHNQAGFDRLAQWGYRGQKAVFLAVMVWLAFDPVLGPRQIISQQTGIALPLLSFDYLVALSAGFLAGNLMLALLADLDQPKRSRRFMDRIGRRASPFFAGLLYVVAAGLLLRNTPAIWLANREPLREYGELALKNLPSGGGLLLSDEPLKLMAFQEAAARAGDRQWVAVNVRRLPQWDYRSQLSRKYPGDWMIRQDNSELNENGIIALITQFAQTGWVYYLHDDSSFLFENLDLEPAGQVMAVRPMPANALELPALSTAAISATEKFWDAAAPRLDMIQKTLSTNDSILVSTIKQIAARVYIHPVTADQSRVLANWYSVALNDWGVRLQCAGQLTAAHKRFTQALDLNPNNIAAAINLQCNSNLVNGAKLNLPDFKMSSRVDGPEHASRFLSDYGMMDQPSFRYWLGMVFLDANMPRQAFQQFSRAHFLAPDVIAPQLAIANLYIRFRDAEQARQMVAQIHRQPALMAGNDSIAPELSVLEAESWLLQTNTANAFGTLESLLREQPENAQVEMLALQTYLSFGDYPDALHLANNWLGKHPHDVSALLNDAQIYGHLGQWSNSIAVYDSALKVTNMPLLQLYRAGVYVEAGQYSAAEADFLRLDKMATNHLATYYGLAEVARGRHDTNAAIDWLERCLTQVPNGSARSSQIDQEISALNSPAASP